MTPPVDSLQFLDDESDSVPGLITTNGVNPRTGRYTIAAPTIEQLCAAAEGRMLPAPEKAAGPKRRRAPGKGYGITDPNSLAERGWGIVFAASDARVDEKKKCLHRLLTHRQSEAGKLYREFSGATGLQPNETGRAFLKRFGDAAGPVAVEKVPYYLLVVASPSEISFAVQTELDSRHAVGRLDFDNLDALERYANDLVAREEAQQVMALLASFFATSNPLDTNTARSARRLATPLADLLTTQRKTWSVEQHLQAAATKPALSSTINSETPPSLLFTASHGLATDSGDTTQRECQGALVTQEWPGLAIKERPLLPAEYFSAADIHADTNLGGMVAFIFACFGAGTPQFDEFLPLEDSTLLELTPTPFVSRLSERLLTAGAGAVIGHVERTWTSAFIVPGAGTQIRAFEETMLKLADGWRVGAAIDVLHTKCNEIANELANALREKKMGEPNEVDIANLVLARTDAANFVIVGDPAARLIVEKMT